MTPAHRFGPTEDKLLAFLARSVRATAEQCTRHPELPSTLGFVRKRLKGLVEAGLLDASHGFSQNGKPPFVYSPTLAGWRYAQEQHGLPIPKRWRPSEARITDFRDYLHDLTITEFFLAVTRLCADAGEFVRLHQFLHDRFLPQVTVQLPDGTQQALRLDAFVDLRLRRGDPPRITQRACLVEIDRSTHYRRALEAKLLGQLAYAQGGYQADWGTQSLTYLWVCPGGEERARYLCTVAEEVLTAHRAGEVARRFLFTPANPATTDPLTLFTGACWFVPFAEHPVSFLGGAPEAAILGQRRRDLPQEEDNKRLRAVRDESVPRVAAKLDVR